MVTLLEKQQHNTDKFLTSYEIRKKLSEVSGYDETLSQETSDTIVSAPVKEFDTELKCGQVRLLADMEEITYLLLLKKWDDNSYLATAFSHYNFPATNEELALGCYAGAYLNVLQIWNTRTLQNSILEKSWVCGEVTEKVCSEAWQFWTSLINGTRLSDEILARTGTLIEDEADPRIEYMREEMSFWARIDEMDFELAQAAEEEPSFPVWDENRLMIPRLWAQEDLSLAAGEEKKNIYLNCHIDEHNELVKVIWDPEEKTLRLTIFDGAQRTKSLDGAKVVDVNENCLGVIAEGKCFIKELHDFDGCFALLLENGEIALLTCDPE